ncbi:SDH family Clp fold serine proteinase [Rheinheimera hassiensis]|uniref:SDH family Clp fold serine proteinase n=1 Tax=Rheinheimera hassiensis TaxID=1193627 RepID=UPI001F05FCF5|nr:hypothetical protein [Rheinheimera hassiensis]
MSKLNADGVRSAISQIEQRRNSRVLVLAATHLDLDLLPQLYNELQRLGRVKRLDLVLQSRGGEINAVRRIAMLLRSYCDELHVLVPYFCQSAATLLALAADQIVAGELAMFSPVDPHLHGSGMGEAETAVSSLDICKFKEMAADWFGMNSEQSQAALLTTLCEQLFPPTLTAFYRVSTEVQVIGEQLLQWQLPEHSSEKRAAMIRNLLTGYHSHHFALSGTELQNLGFKVKREAEIEPLLWSISLSLQEAIGEKTGFNNDARLEAVLLSSSKSYLRTQQPENIRPVWIQE